MKQIGVNLNILNALHSIMPQLAFASETPSLLQLFLLIAVTQEHLFGDAKKTVILIN